MTQFVLLILPETESEKSRAVGPFLAEHLAHSWGNVRGIGRSRRLVWPLEEPKRSVYGQGRHALIPSPGPRGGIAGALHDIVGPPPLPEPVPAKSISVAPMSAGRPVTNWITEEGMALEPQRIVGRALNVGSWKGTVARFGVPTADGRGLEIGDDWLPHFVRMPVPLEVRTLDGTRIVGVVERVHVETDRLEAEGRISLDELADAAPDLLQVNLKKDEPLHQWPAGINVMNAQVGHRPYSSQIRVDGPWELLSVVISSTEVWPDCFIQVDTIEHAGGLPEGLTP